MIYFTDIVFSGSSPHDDLSPTSGSDVPSAEGATITIPHTPTLTNEIISLVLLFCAGRERTWFWVTHVCRRWRTLALSSPFLWTTLHLPKSGTLEYFLTFIERARPHWRCLPLNIVYASVSVRDAVCLGLAAQILELIAGIDTLQLCIPPHRQNVVGHYPPSRRCPAMLRTIESHRLIHLDARGGSRWTARLYAPNIRTLYVNNYPGFWDVLVGMPSLQCLAVERSLQADPKINAIAGTHETTPTFIGPELTEVVAAIGSLINLKQLKLFCDFGVAAGNSATLRLPLLEEAILDGPFECCIPFLAATDFPERASVNITSSRRWPSDSNGMGSLSANLERLCWGTTSASDSRKISSSSPALATVIHSDAQKLRPIEVARLAFPSTTDVVHLTMFLTDAQRTVVGPRVQLELPHAWFSFMSNQPWWHRIRNLTIQDLRTHAQLTILRRILDDKIAIGSLTFIKGDENHVASLISPPGLDPGSPHPLPYLAHMHCTSIPFGTIGPISLAIASRTQHFGKKLVLLELKQCGAVEANHIEFLKNVVDMVR